MALNKTRLEEPRKESEWNTELAEAIALVCKAYGGTVIIPCIGMNAAALVDLRAMYSPLGVTVMHAIGGTRGMVAATDHHMARLETLETLTFKAGV